MDKKDKIIFYVSTFLVLETIPTWGNLGWYWFDILTAVIIATLVLTLSFLPNQWFLEYFLTFIYYIKLTNIISMVASYADKKFPGNLILVEQLSLLNASKPISYIFLYIWYAYVVVKFEKGWRYS